MVFTTAGSYQKMGDGLAARRGERSGRGPLSWNRRQLPCVRGWTPGPRCGTAAIAERLPRLRRRRAGPVVCRPDVDELVALLGRPSRAAGDVAVEVAVAAPAGGVDTEASNRPGTAATDRGVELDPQPARRAHRRVGRRVDALADVTRVNPSTPPPDGTAANRR